MKVLIFTSSYMRPHMLRQCILNVKNQTYKNIFHAINVVSDIDDWQNYLPLIDDIYSSKKMHILHSTNAHTHFNNMAAIKSIAGFNDYDVYIKMDDDDVYKASYVENIVKKFQEDPTIDTVSSHIKYQLNGYKVYRGEPLYDNLGGNPGKQNYHMPMTFAFNNKAFNVIKDLDVKDIYKHDDMMWRLHWEAHSLKHATVHNEEEIVWHVHGRNISTGSFLKP